MSRRPGMVALYFGYRALAALLLAAPVSVLVGGMLGEHPRGDAMLFDAGGLMLTEVARLTELAVPALIAQLGIGALLAAALGLVPLAALIIALGREGPLRAGHVAARVGRAIGPLTLLWGVALAAQVAVAGLTTLIGAKLSGALSLSGDAERLGQAIVIAAALLSAGILGVVHDLARVAAAHGGLGFYDAAARALGVVRAAPLAVGWSWGWRAGVAAGAVVLAAWVGLRVGVASGGKIALAFAVHQAGLLAACWMRASWLAAAIRRVDGLGEGEREREREGEREAEKEGEGVVEESLDERA